MRGRSTPAGAAINALLFAACVGCSGATTGDATDEESEELASSHVFHCHAAYRGTGPEIVKIRLTKTHATLTPVGPTFAGLDADYTYNPSYHPRSASYQGYSQYGWSDGQGHKMVLLFDETMRSGGAALPSGGHGGDVVLEGPRISHGIESMICQR